MFSTRLRCGAIVLVAVLPMAGCSSGGGTYAAPTTTKVTTSSTAGTTTTVSSSRAGIKLGPCPPHYPVGSLETLNAGVAGVEHKLVPIIASKIRICVYDLRLPKTGPVGLTGPQSEIIGTAALTTAVSATLEGRVNAFRRYAAADSSLPGCGGPTYHAENVLLTFANHSERVDVEGDNTRCDPLSNGVFRASPTSSWLKELALYTTTHPKSP